MFRRAPVLKIRAAVIPLLHQACGTEPELAEFSRAVFSARHQTAIIEALVIFDSNQQPAPASLLLDYLRVGSSQHQRLYYQHVLVGPQRGHHGFEMELIGQSNHRQVPFGHPVEHFAVQLRMPRLRIGIEVRIGAESLARKRAPDYFGGP